MSDLVGNPEDLFSHNEAHLVQRQTMYPMIPIQLYEPLPFPVIGIMRKPAFCICENKDADQLRGYSAAIQHLFFSTWIVNPSTS